MGLTGLAKPAPAISKVVTHATVKGIRLMLFLDGDDYIT
jgi:hypothetical protein